MVRISQILSVCFLAFCFVSCNNSTTSLKPIVEYNYWGDEIIFNDTDRDLSIELFGPNGTNRIITLAPAAKDTLKIPVLIYKVEACIQNSSELRICSEDALLAKFVKEEKWLTDYEYEELEYSVVIDGKTCIEDKPWPRYKYHINEELISSGAISVKSATGL